MSARMSSTRHATILFERWTGFGNAILYERSQKIRWFLLRIGPELLLYQINTVFPDFNIENIIIFADIPHKVT